MSDKFDDLIEDMQFATGDKFLSSKKELQLAIDDLRRQLAECQQRAEAAEQERDRLLRVIETGYDLSLYTAAINRDGYLNTTEWTEELVQRIEEFQKQAQQALVYAGRRERSEC